MDIPLDDTPYIVLVDDCERSAELLTRAVAERSGPRVLHLSDADRARASLESMLSSVAHAWPGMVVVDLKSHSGANCEFLAQHHASLGQHGIPLAVMTQPLDRRGRGLLLEAGASAVFFRQADRDAYRHEIDRLVSFWARTPCLDAVGM